MNPPKSNDMNEWADYFIQITEELLEQGFDQTMDREIMAGWFGAVYVLGYDQATLDSERLAKEVDKFIEQFNG